MDGARPPTQPRLHFGTRGSGAERKGTQPPSPRDMTDPALLSLSFVGGMVAFFAPCCIACLPAYFSWLFGEKDEASKRSATDSALRAMGMGLVTTGGLVTVYGALAIPISLASAQIKPWLPLMIPVTGVGIILMGLYLATGKKIALPIPVAPSGSTRVRGFFLFGLGYGVVSLGCTFALFLAVVWAALFSGGVLDAALVFLAFALGKGALLIGSSFLIGVAKFYTVQRLSSWIPHVQKVSNAVLVAMGVYLIYFYWANYVVV